MSQDDRIDESPATGEPDPDATPQSDPSESQIVANPTEQEVRTDQSIQQAERRVLGE